MAPTPTSEASNSTMNWSLVSGSCKIGDEENLDRRARKAASASGPEDNGARGGEGMQRNSDLATVLDETTVKVGKAGGHRPV